MTKVEQFKSVAAAALALAGAAGPALVHGIARGGCRTAILLGRAA